MAWVGASAGGMVVEGLAGYVSSSEASMALRFFLVLVRAVFSFLISVGLGASPEVFFDVGGLGGFDLGVEAGVFSCEDGPFGQLRCGEEFDDGLVGEVGGFFVVFAGFGGGEPGVDHCFPAPVGGGLKLVEALFPPGGGYTGSREAVHAGWCHVGGEVFHELVALTDADAMVGQLAEHGFDGGGPPPGPGTGGGPLSDRVADDPVRGVSSVGGCDGVAPVGVAVAPVGEQGVGVETGSFE